MTSIFCSQGGGLSEPLHLSWCIFDGCFHVVNCELTSDRIDRAVIQVWNRQFSARFE